MPDECAGRMLGERYRLVCMLGEGGMGTVFCAEDLLAGGARVALKVVNRNFGRDRNLVRLKNEAALAAGLRHPNIVAVYDFDRTPEGEAFLSMELIEGEDLRRHIHKSPGKCLPFAETLAILVQIACALRYAHARGVVHRDLKPGNVMLPRAGGVKVMDFGLARLILEERGVTVTQDAIGTPAYLSPEQVRRERPDERTDIYIFGLVAFELAAGRPPFYDENPGLVPLMHLADPVPRLRGLKPEIPQWYDDLVQRCTAKARRARFQSMDEVIKRIRPRLSTEALGRLPVHMRAGDYLYLP